LPLINFLSQVTRKFEGLDADGDGSLTLQEVAAKEIAEKRAEAEQQFARADADSDGKATHAELFEEKDALRAEELFMLTSKPAAKERFSFADTNNDQALDMTEFHVFAHPRDSTREEVRNTLMQSVKPVCDKMPGLSIF